MTPDSGNVWSRARADTVAFCLLLAVSASLASFGCKTAGIDQRLANHPEDYQHIIVLPVCFEAAGELRTAQREAGDQLASALTNCLAAKGYRILGSVRVLATSDDWASLGPDVCQLLRRQFELGRLVSERERTNLLNECSFGSHLPELQRSLNLPDADAVMLLNCTTISRSVPQPPAAVGHIVGVFMLMGGDLSGLEMFDDKKDNPPVFVESLEFSITIFDPHSQQIVFNNFVSAVRGDLSKEKKLRARVRLLLKHLPKIPEVGT